MQRVLFTRIGAISLCYCFDRLTVGSHQGLNSIDELNFAVNVLKILNNIQLKEIKMVVFKLLATRSIFLYLVHKTYAVLVLCRKVGTLHKVK